MRVAALIFAIVFMFVFTACSGNAENNGATEYEITRTDRIEPPTQAEKDLNFKKHLINRMQDAIKDYFEKIDEAVITIEQPGETEQAINVALTIKHDEQLTDEEKEGIINFISKSYSSDLPLNVNLTEERSKN